MASLQDLQQRLAVASERNRTNIANRDRLLAEAKEKFGCKSLDELRAAAAEKLEEVKKPQEQECVAKEKAEKAVAAVEAAVGGGK